MEPIGPKNWRQISVEMGHALRHHTRGRDVLSHGTINWRSVCRTNVLLKSVPGELAVSLTRSPVVAAYWACLPRDTPWDPGIMVVDRPSLAARYRLEPFEYWTEDTVRKLRMDECEERIVDRNVTRLDLHLVGILHREGHLIGKPRFVWHAYDLWSSDWPLSDVA